MGRNLGAARSPRGCWWWVATTSCLVGIVTRRTYRDQTHLPWLAHVPPTHATPSPAHYLLVAVVGGGWTKPARGTLPTPRPYPARPRFAAPRC